MSDNNIIIYSDEQGSIDVRLNNNDVWLSLNQMAELFGRDKSVISRHITNLYKENELDKDSTVAKNATVQKEGDKREVRRDIEYYNLDVVISVGYRVKSNRGVQFRVWANKVLKEYLTRGYVIYNKISKERYKDLEKAVDLVKVRLNRDLSAAEASGLLNLIIDYAYGLKILDKYDRQELSIEKTTYKETFRITYKLAIQTIKELKEKFGESRLFGNEKDHSFKSSVNTIYQTFDGDDLYPSIEEKAAMLLYLIVKNHSFTDGNKRIAASLFLWFLEENGILYNTKREKRIADNTLVALTLLIAESNPEEKDTIVKVIVNLINDNN